MSLKQSSPKTPNSCIIARHLEFRGANIIAESIPPLEGAFKDWEIDGEEPLLVDGVIYAVYGDTDLETTVEARRTCISHLSDGTVDEMMKVFRDSERKLPTEEEEKIIRYRKVCVGCDALGRCGMKIIQYDVKGNQIS